MGHSIAVMNTKGGVGKSTVVMALAETLSAHHGKNVLVIDSDSQTSMSCMLMPIQSWEEMERARRTLVDYLSNMVLGPGNADWREYIARGVSDVEDARSVYLVPSHMELSLFEREVSGNQREAQLRSVVRVLLTETMRMFDIVIVDCPPGLSLLTECWLREVQYFIPPTKPDYLAVRGLSILQRFREEQDAGGFAELLGVLVNLKDGRIASEEDWHAKLLSDPANRCFKAHIPRRAYIQRAADFDLGKRTYIAKYPGDAGLSIKAVCKEVLARLAGETVAEPAPREAAAPRPVAAPAERVAAMPPAPMTVPIVPPRPSVAPSSTAVMTFTRAEPSDPTGAILPQLRGGVPQRPAPKPDRSANGDGPSPGSKTGV